MSDLVRQKEISRLFTEDHITFWQIVTNGFCAWSNLQLFQLFVLFVLWDGILRYSFYSKIDFELWLFVNRWHRIPTKFLSASLIIRRVASDVSFPSLTRNKFPRACRHIIKKRLLLLLRVPNAFRCHFWCGSWGWESFEKYSIFLLRDYSVDAICRHMIVYDCCTWRPLPKSQSLFFFFCKKQWFVIISPNKRHLDHVSNCSALKSSLDSSSSGFPPRKGRVVWRRWSVVLLCHLFLLKWVRSQGHVGCWKNNPCGTVDRYTSHVIFLMQFTPHNWCASHCIGSSVCMRATLHIHAIHGERLIVCCLCPRSVYLRVSLRLLPLLFPLILALTCIPSSIWTAPSETPAAPSHNEEYCPLAIHTRPTGCEPNVLDDFHYSETTEMIFQEESGDKDTEPLYLCDAELDDETIGKALSSPLFIQERGESADRRQAYHSLEESLLPAESFFAHSRTGRPVHELSSCSREKPKSRLRKRANQNSPWKTKSNFSLIVEQRFRNTSSRPIMT